MFYSISQILTVVLPIAAVHLVLVPVGLLLLAPMGLKTRYYVLCNLIIALGVIVGPIGFLIFYAVKGKKIKAANDLAEQLRLKARADAYVNSSQASADACSTDSSLPKDTQSKE